MGIKVELKIKSYEKPEKIDIPHKLKYKIYDMSDAEWKKFQDLTGSLNSFLEGLNKKQEEEYRKKKEEKEKAREKEREEKRKSKEMKAQESKEKEKEESKS